MNKEDVNTFSITFKTTNEAYSYILSWIEAHTELISDVVLPNTQELRDDNKHFKKLIDNVKKAKKERDLFIQKYNK